MPKMVSMKGSYRVPGPNLQKHPITNPDNVGAVYYSPDIPNPVQSTWLHVLAWDDAKPYSIIHLAESLLAGSIVSFEGELATIAELTDELERIFIGMMLHEEKRWSLMSRCVLRFERGRLWQGIRAPVTSFI